MSDVAFTPGSRGFLADRVAWNPGARTQEISLADEAEYSLAGDRQDGAGTVKSRANMPFVGKFRVEISDGDFGPSYAEFDVRLPVTVAGTAWAIVTNVLTVTVPVAHGIKKEQWVVLNQAATAPTGMTGVALIVATVTATTITIAFTSGDASATEAIGVKSQPVDMHMAQPVVLYDNETANDVDINLGDAQAGVYRVFLVDATDQKSADFWSDGTEMVIQTDDAGAGPVAFDDANTDVFTNLRISGGDVILGNRNAIANRIRVEFQAHNFTSVDADTFTCFFEKDGELILKNRSGAAREYALENVGTSRPNRTASPDPNARITELQGPIT